jgi:hypothetical protein
VAQIAAQLEQQGRNALSTLSPGQVALVDQAIATGAQAVTHKD